MGRDGNLDLDKMSRFGSLDLDFAKSRSGLFHSIQSRSRFYLIYIIFNPRGRGQCLIDMDILGFNKLFSAIAVMNHINSKRNRLCNKDVSNDSDDDDVVCVQEVYGWPADDTHDEVPLNGFSNLLVWWLGLF